MMTDAKSSAEHTQNRPPWQWHCLNMMPITTVQYIRGQQLYIICTTGHVSLLPCKHAARSRLFTIDAFITVRHVQEEIFLMMLLAHTHTHIAPNSPSAVYNKKANS